MNRHPSERTQNHIAILLSCIGFCLSLVALRSLYGFDDSSRVTQAERGITQSLEFRYQGRILHVRPQREFDAPISVRLQRVNEHGSNYEARFIGNREGRFDLREYLEHVDGTPPNDLPSMPVQIVSMLPKDQRSDLFDSTVYRPKIVGGYRFAWIIGGLLWISIPCILWGIRHWKKPPVAPVAAEVKEPTVAEQLRPLIEAAAHRPLSTVEKGRLELLLYHFWRERGALTHDNMADSIRKLRTLPEAGELFRVVETWLHSNPEDSSVDRSPEAILAILKPYQSSEDSANDEANVPHFARPEMQPTGQGVAR
ncbi:MAG: hypothetical protein ACK56W_12465 [Pirellula sp.]|jgi:hypothetical protein|nr:hypothetical protein [Pirellula sp.]